MIVVQVGQFSYNLKNIRLGLKLILKSNEKRMKIQSILPSKTDKEKSLLG